MNELQKLLAALLASGGVRVDDGETAILARQLEYIKAQAFDVLFSKLKSRDFIPISNEVPEGAESMIYRMWDEVGSAKLISNYADDLPLVDALAREFQVTFTDIGNAYSWSHRDLKRAAMSGIPLDAKKAQSARNAIERQIDAIAAFGVTEKSLPGFLNHPNVPVIPAITGAWLNPLTTAQQILDDLFALEQQVINQTQEVHEADTLLLPTAHYGKIATTPFGANSDRTILQYFLANAQTIRNVDRWNRLATAGLGGIARALAYVRSPECLEFQIPTEFEQLPPQTKNLSWIVNCIARVGGVVFYRPLSACYMDGI
jgi:hypothetical protein